MRKEICSLQHIQGLSGGVSDQDGVSVELRFQWQNSQNLVVNEKYEKEVKEDPQVSGLSNRGDEVSANRKKRLYRKGTYFGSGDSVGKRLNQKQTF